MQETLVNGLVSLSWSGYVIVTLVMTHLTIVSVTVFLHRHQSHRALSLHPAVSHAFRCWLWLTTGMVTREWVAVHRKHHDCCETPDDPHSPRVNGLLRVLLGGVGLYRRAARDPATLDRYGRGTPDDWLERHFYAPRPVLGITLMLLIDLMLFGYVGLLIFLVQMLWIPLWAAGVINGVGHFWGYRNFETADAATNIVPWGILIGGEELHNNHHAYAASARLSSKRWEFDIGWFYIRLLERAGLAAVHHVAPGVDRHPVASTAVDTETVMAVVNHRYLVLKLYGTRVIRPVLKEAQQSADRLAADVLDRAGKWLVREDLAPERQGEAGLTAVLGLDQTLETVYRFKQQLKEIWTRPDLRETRVQRLRAWCDACEATGIRQLEEFSAYLRSYRLAEA